MPKLLLRKMVTCIVAGVTFSALLLVLGNSGQITWLPPAIVFSLVGVSVLAALILPFVWQFWENKRGINSEKIYAFFYAFTRYCIAFNIASFGWKKILGLQFIVPAEIAALPINQQSGEWLTWYYFGHSPAFGLIIALTQIGGSFLLLFRKTLLLGSMILFSIMLNLTLINIFYQMNAGALLQSLILTIGISFLILLDYNRIVNFFFKSIPGLPFISLNSWTKNMLRFSALLLSLLFVLYIKTLIKE